MATYTAKYFAVSFPAEYVALVEINRPEKLNAFRPEMWAEMRETFTTLSTDPAARIVLLTGAGDRAFSAGLDVQFANESGPVSQADAGADTARRATAIRRHIADYQAAVTAVELCEKPVVALLHGISFGAAVDIATACCVRYVAANARLCIKEVDLGLAADVGTLSRLPKIGVPLGWAKEVSYSAREFGAQEASRVGFVSGEVYKDKKALMEAGLALGKLIASKSPVAVQGTKHLIDYSRDHTIEEGLRYTGVWNAAMLQSSDVERAMKAGMRKEGRGQGVRFEKL